MQNRTTNIPTKHSWLFREATALAGKMQKLRMKWLRPVWHRGSFRYNLRSTMPIASKAQMLYDNLCGYCGYQSLLCPRLGKKLPIALPCGVDRQRIF